MAFDPITGAEAIANLVLGRLLPDKTARDAATANIDLTALQGDIAAKLGQLTVDANEASNQSLFVAGWRPFVGWACGFAFVYVYIAEPLMQFLLVAFKVNFDVAKLPVFDIGNMMMVLLGMLGLGAMRSYDKTNGTGNGH